MSNKIKISVIVPTIVKNKEWLKSTINSILKNKPFEIIIVVKNKNQKKEVIELLSNKQKKTKIIIQKHKLLNGARYDGALNATGNIVTFIDDDVIIPKDYLNNVKKIFEKNRDIIAITANKTFSKDSQKRFGIICKKHKRIENVTLLEGNFMAIRKKQLIETFKSKYMNFNIQPADDVLLSLILNKKFHMKTLKYGDIIHNEGLLGDEIRRFFNYGRGEVKLFRWLLKNKIPIMVRRYTTTLIWLLGLTGLTLIMLINESKLLALLILGYLVYYVLLLQKYKLSNPIKAIIFLTLCHLSKTIGFIFEILNYH